VLAGFEGQNGAEAVVGVVGLAANFWMSRPDG
jgi:hypothetical protein